MEAGINVLMVITYLMELGIVLQGQTFEIDNICIHGSCLLKAKV